MRRLALSLSLSLLALMASHAAAQDQSANQPQQPPQPSGDEVSRCQVALWTHPTMAPVMARFKAHTLEEAIKLRTSTAKATSKEKPAIAFWLAEIEKCNQLLMQKMANLDVEARTLARDFQLAEKMAITDLYAGTITWGAYVEGDITRLEAFKVKADAYEAKQKQAQVQSEAEQKRLADAKKAEQDAQAPAR